MTSFQKIIITLALMTSSLIAFAEEKGVVRGVVVDAMTGAPLEFANVAATDKNGNLCHMCASDASGEFVLAIKKNGDYTIKLSYVGYKLWGQDIHFDGKDIDLERISLEQDSSQIEASSITSKSLIKRESDRIIYDVSADPEAAAISMTAMMAKIPGLAESIKDGRLRYNEMSLEKILIDDTDHPMINKSRQYPMRFITADHMSKIELILPGSPRYANDKPMIVIRMAKPLPYGFASETDASSSTINDHMIIPDIIINTPLVGVGVKYNFTYSGHPIQKSETERSSFDPESGSITSTLKSERETDAKSSSHNLDMDLFRSFANDRLLVNATILTQYLDNTTISDILAEREVSGISTTQSSRTLSSAISKPTLNGGLSMQYRWAESSRVSATCTVKNASNYTFYEHDTGEIDSGISNSTEVNTSTVLSMGARAGSGRIYNTLTGGAMLRRYNQEGIYSGVAPDEMDYSQNVFYVNNNFSWYPGNRKLSLSLILHLEDVLNSGLHKLDDSKLDYHNTNFVPYFHLRISPSRRFSTSMSYYFSFRRPTSDQLSIDVNSSDPDNLVVGNPKLTGERTHYLTSSGSYRLGTNYGNAIDYMVSYEATPNAIELLSTVDADNIRTTTFANIGFKRYFRSSLSGRFNLFSKVHVWTSIDYFNRNYSISDAETNSYWSWAWRSSLSGNLKIFSIESGFNITPYNNLAQSLDQKHEFSCSLVLSRYFSKYNLGVSVGLHDLTHGRSSYKTYTTGAPSFLQEQREQRLGRYLRIDLRYSFGRFRAHTSVAHKSYDME